MQPNLKRPVFLNLAQIRFPITALVSIAHRLSGLGMLLAWPLMVYWLDRSLLSENEYDALINTWRNVFWAKLALWGFLLALYYHLLAGVRHLLMDLHLAHSLQAARYTSIGVILIFLIGAAYWTNILWRVF